MENGIKRVDSYVHATVTNLYITVTNSYSNHYVPII